MQFLKLYYDKWCLPAEIHPIHKGFVIAGLGDFTGLYLMNLAAQFVDTKEDTIPYNQANEILDCLLVQRVTNKKMPYDTHLEYQYKMHHYYYPGW